MDKLAGCCWQLLIVAAAGGGGFVLGYVTNLKLDDKALGYQSMLAAWAGAIATFLAVVTALFIAWRQEAKDTSSLKLKFGETRQPNCGDSLFPYADVVSSGKWPAYITSKQVIGVGSYSFPLNIFEENPSDGVSSLAPGQLVRVQVKSLSYHFLLRDIASKNNADQIIASLAIQVGTTTNTYSSPWSEPAKQRVREWLAHWRHATPPAS
ncbi:hypothetical protein [Chitiniphilus shinanonensis]|uniref:hypothetical protein n=1 Tax=Chitiniphilus shinanonensis TaxID=553088 RepID=UPI003068DE48